MASSTGFAASTGGIGFLGLLALLFIGLKLTGYIDWSWWWALSPLWIPLAVIGAIVGCVWLVWGLLKLCLCFLERKENKR